jgi:hypothetical protein
VGKTVGLLKTGKYSLIANCLLGTVANHSIVVRARHREIKNRKTKTKLKIKVWHRWAEKHRLKGRGPDLPTPKCKEF